MKEILTGISRRSSSLSTVESAGDHLGVQSLPADLVDGCEEKREGEGQFGSKEEERSEKRKRPTLEERVAVGENIGEEERRRSALRSRQRLQEETEKRLTPRLCSST